jgi:sugar/nucleoside kinase (ribokinase family)
MYKKFDIVALGELNIDLILNRIEGFPEIGKEILADDCVMTLGSSTAIFAANAASLGCDVAFLGMVGNDDFGQFNIKSFVIPRGRHLNAHQIRSRQVWHYRSHEL